MQYVAGGCERSVFPAFSKLADKLLFTPIKTASVERSFSNLHRTVTDTRSRLLPINQGCLLRLSMKGLVNQIQHFWKQCTVNGLNNLADLLSDD
jgi:hypothetical protein